MLPVPHSLRPYANGIAPEVTALTLVFLHIIYVCILTYMKTYILSRRDISLLLDSSYSISQTIF